MLNRLSTAATLSLALCAGAAQAAPTFYATRGAFESTLSVSVTDTYENPGYVFIQSDAAMSAVLGETDYRATGFGDLNIVFNTLVGKAYCAGCNGSFELSFTSTSVGGSGGVFGVGLDIVGNAGTPDYVAFITYGDGATQEVDLPQGSGFFGLTSTDLVRSIHFGLAGGGSTQLGSFSIDNLTIGGPGRTVPEPGGLALVGLALAAAGLMRRRA